MPDTPSVTMVHKFTYRGAVEEFSNTYHFSGTVPTSDANWLALIVAIWTKEKAAMGAEVFMSRAYGYEAGEDNSVYQADTTTSGFPGAGDGGQISASGNLKVPGDVAATVRWYTGEHSSRGKKVYCRKYFHGVYGSTTTPDNVATAQLTALNTYAAGMIDGTLPGGVKYCGPQGAVLSAPAASVYLTTRTLKRRGKRPPTSP